MKKTLIALVALGSVAMADTLTTYDQWTFDSNLTSINNRTFAEQQVQTTLVGGALQLQLKTNGTSGIYLKDDNVLGLETDWALQLTCTIPTGNSTGTAQVLTCLNNESGGTQLAIANQEQHGQYGFAKAPGFIDWSDTTRSNTTATIGSPMVLTLMNYGGNLYLAQDKDWAKFGTGGGTDYVSVGDKKLNKLTLGFGQNGQYGLSAQTITVDNLTVYTFNSQAASVDQVKAALMSNVPEPTTGALSLLALAGLCIRRRK